MMLDDKVKKYILSAKNVIEKRDGKSLTCLLQNSQSLLQNLDIVVSSYQLETELKTKKLQIF